MVFMVTDFPCPGMPTIMIWGLPLIEGFQVICSPCPFAAVAVAAVLPIIISGAFGYGGKSSTLMIVSVLFGVSLMGCFWCEVTSLVVFAVRTDVPSVMN